jgi:hypothetical protein
VGPSLAGRAAASTSPVSRASATEATRDTPPRAGSVGDRTAAGR